MSKNKQIVIIGAGPAGVMCAIEASKNPLNDIILIDPKDVLDTILPTGGGRCNLAYNDIDAVSLAKNFPRGEKFLYSVFNRFATSETMQFFTGIGVNLSICGDNRIFPMSNSALKVKEALFKQLQKPNIRIWKNKVTDIAVKNGIFEIQIDGSTLTADCVVMASGGKGNGHWLAQKTGHGVTQLKPALAPLKIKEDYLFELQGISLRNIETNIYFKDKKVAKIVADLLFTHKSISGPLAHKISSLCAFLPYNDKNPLVIYLNIVRKLQDEFTEELKNLFLQNRQKNLINTLSPFTSRHLLLCLLEKAGINAQKKCADIGKSQIKSIAKLLCHLEINATAAFGESAMVTAGGIELKEVDSKTMQSKIVSGLFFCGEILDIDGFTGGFNLQNCWSTGFVCGNSLSSDNY